MAPIAREHIRDHEWHRLHEFHSGSYGTECMTCRMALPSYRRGWGRLNNNNNNLKHKNND